MADNPADIAALGLPAWPASLPFFDASGIGAAPTPIRKAFATDSGIPIIRRTAASGWVKYTGELGLTVAQRAVLQAFHDDPANETFTVLHQITGDTWIGRWAEDGSPSDKGSNAGLRRTSIGLYLSPV